MELNALTRWESVGKDLYKKGKIGEELERLSKYSLAARNIIKNSINNNNNNNNNVGKSNVASIEESIQEEIEQSTLDETIPVEHAKHIIYLYCTLRRFCKGFFIGYLGKLMFIILGALVKTRGKLPKLIAAVKPHIRGNDTVGYGLFLGIFLTVFEQIMRSTHHSIHTNTNSPTSKANNNNSNINLNITAESLKSLFKFTSLRLSRRVRVLLASTLSSIAFLFLPRDSQLSISMFFFVRAIEITGKYYSEIGVLPQLKHGDTLLMALASLQVIWAWLFFPDTLEPNYKKFLDFQGGRNINVQHAFSMIGVYGTEYFSKQQGLLSRLNAWRAANNYPPIILNPNPTTNQYPNKHSLACRVLHPDSPSCIFGFCHFFRAAYLRALPVYAPVYVLPLLLFRLRSLIKNPLNNFIYTTLGVLRSSLFLSMYCSIAWLTACTLTNLKSHNTYSGMVAGFCAGLTVLIEKKNRRIELALYVLSQAIPSFTRTMQYYHIFPKLKHFEFIIFILSINIIMHSYVIKPHLLRASYLSLLRFFFGSGGRTAHFHTKKQLNGPILSTNKLHNTTDNIHTTEQDNNNTNNNNNNNNNKFSRTTNF